MDRIEAMKAFVAVAELRGFARAARRLGVSPPVVTRLIAALEDLLSIRLLHRTTRSVKITDAGARYLERARRILSEIEEAEHAARAEQAEPTGRFAVTAPLVFGRREVAPLLSEFMKRHSSVRCELTLADRIVHLIDEDIDLAVRIGALADSSLRVRPVGSTRRVAVASPAYLAEHPKLRSPLDLEAHATIQCSALTTSEWRFFRRGEEERITVQPALITNSVDVAVAHASRGGGVTIALSYQVVKEIRSGALQIVLEKFEPPPLPIQIVHPAARLPSANIRAFVDLVLEARRWSFVDIGR
jgi:DNA-binding transcriptional LysR family regulator